MTSEEKEIIAKHQEAAPVDITALANELGLSVYDDYDLPAGISGKICRVTADESPSGYSISVNANEPYGRRRFTVAHECAHFLLHRDKIGDGLSDNAMYRSDKMNTKEEFDANNLAADLLMPRSLIQAEMSKGHNNPAQLAEIFQVSQPAMQVRMRYLYQREYQLA
jgi:IrrE N-terminal-like domain